MSSVNRNAGLMQARSRDSLEIIEERRTPLAQERDSPPRDDQVQRRVSTSQTRAPRRPMGPQEASTASRAQHAERSQALTIRAAQPLSPVSRAEAVDRFNALVASGEAMKLSNPEVQRAIVFHAALVGLSAAAAFGIGRSFGADAAEMIVRAAFDKGQLAGVEPDTVDYEDSHKTAMMFVTVVARWVGATIGGGMGAAVGNVVAPRIASLAGRQFQGVPANELVPDHVADLIKPDGTPYGQEGVDALRARIGAVQRSIGNLGGETHVLAGQVAFGAGNAVRGLGQGKQPMGMPVDVPLTTGVSAGAGAATAVFSACAMARERLPLPDASYTGTGAAPMVNVPVFGVGDPAAIPDRFTGPTHLHTASNIAAGVMDRSIQMAHATAPLGAANLTGTAIAAVIPETPGQIGHRLVQSAESGAGVAAAVEPWFKAQGDILARDKARIAAQEEQVRQRADLEQQQAGTEMTRPNQTGE